MPLKGEQRVVNHVNAQGNYLKRVLESLLSLEFVTENHTSVSATPLLAINAPFQVSLLLCPFTAEDET